MIAGHPNKQRGEIVLQRRKFQGDVCDISLRKEDESWQQGCFEISQVTEAGTVEAQGWAAGTDQPRRWDLGEARVVGNGRASLMARGSRQGHCTGRHKPRVQITITYTVTSLTQRVLFTFQPFWNKTHLAINIKRSLGREICGREVNSGVTVKAFTHVNLAMGDSTCNSRDCFFFLQTHLEVIADNAIYPVAHLPFFLNNRSLIWF